MILRATSMKSKLQAMRRQYVQENVSLNLHITNQIDWNNSIPQPVASFISLHSTVEIIINI